LIPEDCSGTGIVSAGHFLGLNKNERFSVKSGREPERGEDALRKCRAHQPIIHQTKRTQLMRTRALTSAAGLAFALLSAAPANAAVTVFAEYQLGEPLTLGTNNLPLDSIGGRDFTDSINPGGVTVGSPGAYAGSAAFMDTSSAANSGYYALNNFTSLPNNNVAIGVYARASAIAGNTGTIFGTGDGGGMDLSLSTNGWAGSLFNVAWVGPAGGAAGSFVADRWVHLALITADGLTTFYIDGVPQGASLATTPVNSSPHMSVSPGGATYFDGGIDDARAVFFGSGESTAAVLGALQGIPEPSSAAFLALGCLAFARRRR
jgi:hypothetical protein